jgi:hypothetical protein
MTEQHIEPYEPNDDEAGEILSQIDQDADEQQPSQDADNDESTDDDRDESQDEGKGGKAHREAAKYRTQLREVEQERDQLTEQVTTLQKQLINTEIQRSRTGVTPDLVWEIGTDPTDLLNKDGSINADKVRTTLGSIGKRFGIRPPADATQAAVGNYTPDHETPVKLFDNTLR